MSGTQEEASKLVSYEVLSPIDERASKIVTYEVLSSTASNLSKTVSYLVLQPTVPPALELPAPPAAKAFLARQQVNNEKLPSLTRQRKRPFTVANQPPPAIHIPPGLSPSLVRLRHQIINDPIIVVPNQRRQAVFTAKPPVPVNPATQGVPPIRHFLRWQLKINEKLYNPFRQQNRFFPIGVVNTEPLFVSDLDRVILGSAGTSGSINIDGLPRVILGAGNAPIAVSGVTITYLAQQLPPDPPIPVFPDLPQGFPVKFSPAMETVVGTTKSLREIRVPQRLTPLWDLEIVFEELRDQTQNVTPYTPFAGFTQYEQLVQLWLMMYGQTNIFAFFAPWDNSRTDQTIGVGDGLTYIFPIYRTWGQGGQATLALIGNIREVFNVKVNGVTIPTAKYKVSRNKLYFLGPNGQQFPPAVDAVVTMTMSYYYICRFVEDEQDFEEFGKNRWTLTSLKFRAVYWP
jgi:hypothetical protein